MAQNITSSADPALIERARARAHAQQTTLNAAFRQWLASYAAEQDARASYKRVVEELAGVTAGRSFTPDELNER